MKKLIQKIYHHTLFRGSIVMFAGTMIVNIGNYFYHLIMGRMLGPEKYGILASIISSLYLLGIIPLTLGVVITKYISEAYGKSKKNELNIFYYWVKSKLVILGMVAAVLLLIIIPLWAGFLRINDYRLFIAVVVAFPVTLLLLLTRSYFTGTLNFGYYSISTIIETAIKIIFSILLVILGWSVFGAITGMVTGSVLAYLICLPFVKAGKKPEKIVFVRQKEIFSYSIFVFISTIGFTSLYSSDIILVKHFFSSFDAGIYASLSVLGKIVFFVSSSLVGVMFPLISQKHARRENISRVFWLVFGSVGCLSIAVSIIYFIAPSLMISILFGSKYLSGKELLFPIAVFISLYSLSSVVVNFFLSIGNKKAAIFPFAAALLQIILIIVWHNDLMVVIRNSTITTFVLLISLLLYYRHEKRA